MTRVLAALLGAVLLMPAVLAEPANPHAPYNRALSKKDTKWVQETLRKMSLDEKIGQLFLADGNAIFMSRSADAYKQIEHHVRDNKVGGIILFRSDVWATAVLTNRMQALAKVPLLISSDLEMGMGMRLNDTPWWPPNMAVAATGDPALARRQGETTAREARAIGINWLYAPVADVNNNPDNPVINTRSYGEDPQRVAEFVTAFVEGAQGAGALACVKHFPGHGDTATDSHIGLPVVNVNRARLDSLELVPFRAAIARGVGSVMSAHIALPQIDPTPAAGLRALSAAERASAEFVSRTEVEGGAVTRPATLSAPVLTGILRGSLRFAGVIASDAMNMAGVDARYDPATGAIEAIKAGIDVVEKCPDIDAAIAGVKAAVRRGEITQARINQSVERILAAKARLGLPARRSVAIEEVDRVVSSLASNELGQQIADRSITVVRLAPAQLPLQPTTRILHVGLADDDGAFSTQVFVSELRSRKMAVAHLAFDMRSTEADLARLTSALDARQFDTVVLSSLIRARSGKGSVGLPPIGQRIVGAITASKVALVAISFGNPYLLTMMPDVPTYVAAYSPYPFSQRAAARALMGEFDVQGTLPVSLPGLHPRGHGIRVLKRAVAGSAF